MAKNGVKFSSGGKLTDLGKSVKNITSRLNRYARKTGATVNTKDIRNQVRQMVEQGRSESYISEKLNSIRDSRLGELFVDKKTGELITDVSSVPISALDSVRDFLDIDNELEDRMRNNLLRGWLQDLETEFSPAELDNVLQKNAAEIQEALETVIYGYMDKGTVQGLDTAIIRLYEITGVDMTWDKRQAIFEGVERYAWYYAYGVTNYDGEEF